MPPKVSRAPRPGWRTPQMIRVVLDFIEEEKGPESLLIKGRAAALHRVYERLESATVPEGYTTLDPESVEGNRKILDKLNRLTASASDKIPSNNMLLKLFLDGSLAFFNIQSLPKDTYSTEEIQAWRTEEERKKLKTLAEVGEMIDNIEETSTEPAQPPRGTKRTREIRDKIVEVASKAQSVNPTTTVANVSGKNAPKKSKLVKKAIQGSSLLGDSPKAQSKDSEDAPATKRRLVNQDTQTAGTEMTNHRDFLDPEDINRTMEGIVDHIYHGLEIYMRQAQLNAHHIVDMAQVELSSSVHLDFFNYAFGHQGLQQSSQYLNENGGLRLIDFAASLIGTAVADWSLREPQKRFDSPLLKSVRESLTAYSPDLADYHFQKATANTLELWARPYAQRQAALMARDIVLMLEEYVFSQLKGLNHSWPMLSQPDQLLQKFEDGLVQDVSLPALNMRIDMEIKGNARYHFDLPCTSEAFQTDNHVARAKDGYHALQVRQFRNDYGFTERPDGIRVNVHTNVLVPILPLIEAEYRGWYKGELCWMDERRLVSKAHVRLIDPPAKPAVIEGSDEHEKVVDKGKSKEDVEDSESNSDENVDVVEETKNDGEDSDDSEVVMDKAKAKEVGLTEESPDFSPVLIG